MNTKLDCDPNITKQLIKIKTDLLNELHTDLMIMVDIRICPLQS